MPETIPAVPTSTLEHAHGEPFITTKSGRRKIPGARKIRRKELPPFTRQMSAMLAAGLPVVQTLIALEDQTTHKQFIKIIADLRLRIEGGASLSEALSIYPDVFDELYVSIIEAGETGGLLAETTGRIAGYLEDSERLRRKVVSALMYPAIVSVVAVLLTTAMIIWIVPVFSEIYGDFGAKLPGPTQFLVDLSYIVRHYLLFVVAGVVLLSVGLVQFKKTEKGGLIFDRLRLRFPVLGQLALKVALSRFALTFAQLTRSGVPILRSLEIVSIAVGNKVLGKAILKARAVVEQGEPLSTALAGEPFFPPIVLHMLAAGEKTSKVDDMLQRVADFYDDEVESMLAGLTSLIEPLLIVFLGVIVGGIVVCMFLPIFKMHEIVGF